MKAITSGFQGVNNKIGDLESKVTTVVDSVQELSGKCERQEEGMADLQQKFARIQTELKETREEVAAMKMQKPTMASVVRRGQEVLTGANTQGQEKEAGQSNVREDDLRQEVRMAAPVSEVRRDAEQEGALFRELGREEQIKIICEKSRRTVGFARIGEDDISRMYGEAVPYGGAKNREEAILLAVQEFMDYELKIKPKEQESMAIEDLFERKSEQLDTIYVRFRFRSSLSKIFEKVHHLRKGSNLVTYIPREFQDRFRALNNTLKPIREEGKGWRTRVKLGIKDLVVSKKKKEMGAVYEELEVNMEDLPPVVLTRPKSQVTDSPPPGRPGHTEERNKRRRSGMSHGESPNNKTPRQEEDAGVEEIEKSKVGTEEEIEEVEETESEDNITRRRKKKKPAAYCGSPTISPLKEGEGLLARPSVGEVVEVTGRQGGKQKEMMSAGQNNMINVDV